MKTCIQKWGNSLALRIPKSFAAEVRLKAGCEVEISPVDGKLVVFPVSESEFNLKHLLTGITEQNRHHEVDTGKAVGNEVW